MKKVDGGGLRYNEGKARVDLVPASTIFAMAGVMEQGAKKYAPHNWRRGMSWMSVYGCLVRHLLKWVSPFHSDIDEESGQPHMAHVLTNAAFLIEYSKTCPELDDRYKIDKDEEEDECFASWFSKEKL